MTSSPRGEMVHLSGGEKLEQALAELDEINQDIQTFEKELIGKELGRKGRKAAKKKEKREKKAAKRGDSAEAANVRAKAPKLKRRKSKQMGYPLHRTHNTLAFLDEVETARKKANGAEHGLKKAWLLRFRMPKSHEHMIETAAVIENSNGSQEDKDADTQTHEVHDEHPISHEAWVICERLLACDFKITHKLSFDAQSLTVLIATPTDALIQEAHHCKLKVRMTETKGSIPFHEDLMKYFPVNHGGLNEYKNGIWERRDPSKAWAAGFEEDDMVAEEDDDEEVDEEKAAADRSAAESDDEGEPQEDEDEDKGGGDKKDGENGSEKDHLHHDAAISDDAHTSEKSIFTSAMCQELCIRRMKRVGMINLSQYLNIGKKSPKKIRDSIRSLASGHKVIRAAQLVDMLICHGGMRPGSVHIFPEVSKATGKMFQMGEAADPADGVPVVNLLGTFCRKDPDFVLTWDKTKGVDKIVSHVQHFLATGVETGGGEVLGSRPSYKLILAVCDVLDYWRDAEKGPGREEQFAGTLEMFMPCHDFNELHYLSAQWGSFDMLLKTNIVGYNPEQMPKVLDRGPPQQVEQNTFGSYLNVPHEHALPWAWSYQPLEEVRDYFGEEVALYFSWLGHYTASLMMSSVLGIFTQILQMMTQDNSVDQNPATLVYSVYVGLWSISFIAAWGRRENEHRFLWGTSGLSLIEEPRIEFKGEVVYNPDTGRVTKVPYNNQVQLFKRVASVFVVLLMMVITVMSATGAMLLRYLGDAECNEPGDEGCDDTALSQTLGSGSGSYMMAEGDGAAVEESFSISELFEQQKYVILSSSCNLFIISTYGFIFEAIAEKLNKFENHRTQSEYENGLVYKNFCFQFINNYFILFYIAYMREIPDPFTQKAHPCQGSCLDELQFQLMIVFTGKTIGKQLMNLLKPFAYRAVQQTLANRHMLKLIKQARQGASKISAISRVTAFIPTPDNLLADDREKDVRDIYEIQAKKMAYPGSFDDFNDRVIQFGYLVLFAPAYPLAPFLAFFNNVFEIRSAGYRMCHGYSRPVCVARETIGAWGAVLNILGFMAVITNASMLAFVGSQWARRFDLLEQQEMNCVLGVWSVEEQCHYGKDGGANLLSKRVDYYQLWVVFMLIEHGMMMLRVTILMLAPQMPEWIKIAGETLEYRSVHVFKTKDQLELEAAMRDAYINKLQDKKSQIREALQYDEGEMRDRFDKLDTDKSGAMEKSEVTIFLRSLGVSFSDAEINMAIAAIDTDGEQTVAYDELTIWLQKNDMWDPEAVSRRRAAGKDAVQKQIAKAEALKSGQVDPSGRPLLDADDENGSNRPGSPRRKNGSSAKREVDAFDEMHNPLADPVARDSVSEANGGERASSGATFDLEQSSASGRRKK